MSVPNDIEELIRSSGNHFHSKVARWLVDDGWHVIVSPYYLDQTQGKAREIDIVAEKPLAGVSNSFRREGEIIVRLFVECKYVSAPSVFWMANKCMKRAEEIVYKTGIYGPEWSDTKQHHYMEGSPVAKVFASSKNKLPENEPFYKALNQVLHAMVSMRGRPAHIPELDQKLQNGWRVHVLEFPVVVCSSFESMYATDFYEESAARPLSGTFQLEVSYAYTDKKGNGREECFLIDFVDFDNMSSFVSLLEEDAKGAAHIIELREHQQKNSFYYR